MYLLTFDCDVITIVCRLAFIAVVGSLDYVTEIGVL
jgi:hypothetical protein